MTRTLLGASALALVAALSAAADEGPYVKGMIGVGSTSDLDVRRGDEEFDIQAEGALRGLIGGGYAFSGGVLDNWRLDGDVVYRPNDLGSIGNLNDSDVEIDNVAAMVHAIRDFNRGGALNPYIGVGTGVSFTEIDVDSVIGSGSGDETSIAGEALVGLGLKLTPRLRADVEYRYFRTAEDVEFTVGGVEHEFRETDSHDVFFGLRFSFNEPTRSATRPAPPPEGDDVTAAALAPVCDDLPFVVYFGWDNAELTPQALRVIERAADQAEACEITRITIIGHADTSGDANYNLGLSARRANMVREELVRKGVAGSLIMVEGLGEQQPAVATGDGVREPLNRRAEATIIVVK